MYQEPKHIVSSYNENNIGQTIYDVVRKLKPKKVIEFGSLYGYSTVCIGQALRANGSGHLISYDIYDEYEYKNADREVVQSAVDLYGLQDWVSLEYEDYYNFINNNNTDWDLAHIDISNTGDTLAPFIRTFNDKSIIFEGGSPERDNNDWMTKYDTKPIKFIQNLFGYQILNSDYPSLSGRNI